MSDVIRFACGSCGHKMAVGGEHAGKLAKCRKCGSPQVVPQSVVDSGEIMSGTSAWSAHSMAPPPIPPPIPSPPPAAGTLICPHCSGHVAMADDLLGQLVACPHCAKQFKMPGGPVPPVVPHLVAAVVVGPAPPRQMHCRNCGRQVLERAVVCLTCGMRPQDGNQFCPSCAAPTQAAQAVCLKCGIGLRGGALAAFSGGGSDRIAASNPPKDPILMALLSGLCIAGLGQMILGQVVKGVAILLGSMVLGAVTLGVSIIVTWPIGGVDAYLIAKKLKEGKTVGQWEFF